MLGVSIWWHADDDGECGVEWLQLIESRPVLDGDRDGGGGCWVKSKLRHVLLLPLLATVQVVIVVGLLQVKFVVSVDECYCGVVVVVQG